MSALSPLGPLILEARLGQGGMGVVYKATHPEYGAVCAKLLHPATARDPAALRRFKREALAASKLDHPNIVKGFGLHEFDGQPVFLQAFVEGGDLEGLRQAQGGRLAISQGIELAAGLCEGLAAAHEAGFVHRDLKPQNVMLDAARNPLIADFGLVLSVDGAPLDGQTVLTQDGQILGSPWFMSPEQIDSPHEVSGATDVYALGIMLHYLWTARFPIAQDRRDALSRAGTRREQFQTLCEVFEAHKSQAPTSLRQDRPDAPPDIEALLLACLDKDPDRRPTSAELAQSLRSLMAPSDTIAETIIEARTGTIIETRAETKTDTLIGALVQGRYQVQSLLGQGGFGAVYKARHRELGLDVALKFLDPLMARDSDLKERFKREAKVLMSFTHKSAVTLRDYGEHQGQPYLAMDYVEGRELRAVLTEDGPLNEAQARDLAEQVLSCLEEAQAAGLVHRDLKPENIMVTELSPTRCAVRVLDWGIAKALGDRALEMGFQQSLTRGTIGTLHYASPEQAGGDPIDHRSDLYALSAVLYEAVSGKKPLQADTARRLILQILSAAPPPLEDAADQTLSPSFVAAVMKGLEKEPGDRHTDAGSYRQSLQQAAPPPPPTPASPPPAPPPSPPSSRAGLLIGLIVFLGLAALILAFWPEEKKPSKPPVVGPEPVEPRPLIEKPPPILQSLSLTLEPAPSWSREPELSLRGSVNRPGVKVSARGRSIEADGPFELTLPLEEGVNTIEVIAEAGDQKARKALRLRCDLSPPKITVVGARDGQINIAGAPAFFLLRVDEENLAELRVNGERQPAVSRLRYSFRKPVPNGSPIPILARDQAGNESRIEVKVFFKRPGSRGSLPPILRELKSWNRSRSDPQDRAINAVAARLGPAYELIETVRYYQGRRRPRLASFRHKKSGIELMLIPGGSFSMGSEKAGEGPVHPVRIREPFLIGRTEVSQAQWDAIGGEDSRRRKDPKLPIARCTWDAVQAWLEKAGDGLRLPSESEWEYACRADSSSPYSFGDRITQEQVNFSSSGSLAVGSMPVNAFGLHEMHGNLREWVQDAFFEDYRSGPRDERPREAPAARFRVARGGSWGNGADFARSAHRESADPRAIGDNQGFRVAKSLD